MGDVYPPFEFRQDGRWQGMSLDYLAEICRRLGLEYQVTGLQWSEALERIVKGQDVDLLLAVTHSPERKAMLALSKPYLVFPQVIFTRKQSAFVGDIRDLAGATIAVEKDYVMETWLRRDLPRATFLTPYDTLSALKLLASGRADAYVGNLAVAEYLIEKNGLVDIKVAAPSDYGDDELCFGVRKDWPELTALIDKALASFSEEDHRAIRNKWLSLRVEHGIRTRDVGFWVLLVAGLSFVWILSLRIQVKRRTAELEQEVHRRQESEQKARAIFDQTYEFVGMLTPDGVLIDANRTALDFAGLEPAAVLGKYFWDTQWWSHSAEMQQKVREAVTSAAAGTVVRFEATHRATDGTLRYVDFSLKPVRDNGGELRFLLPEGRDITEVRQAETSLRTSEKLYRSLFESAGDAIFLMREDRFVECNLKTLKMFGCSREEILGETPYRFSPQTQPDGRASADKAQEKISAALTGEPQFFEWKHVTYGGEQFDAEVSLTRIDLPSGAHIQAIVRDVSERKLAEDRLRDSEKKLRLVLDNSPFAGYVLGPDGKSLYANRASVIISGYSSEELLGKDFTELVHPEDLDRIRKIREARMAGEPVAQNYVFRIIDKSGIVHWVENDVIMMQWEGLPASLGYLRDVTERRKAEEELQIRAQLLDGASDSIFLLGENGRILYANEAAAGARGYSREEMAGLNIRDLVRPELRGGVAARLGDIVAKGEVVFESEHLRRNGETFPVDTSARLVVIDGRKYIIGIVRDITERKRAEAEREKLIADIQGALGAVSRSQKEWQETFDSITDMISIHDKDFTIVRANKAFSENLGLSPREVIGRKCHELLHHGASSPVAGCPHYRTMQDKVNASEEVYDEITKKTLGVSTYPYFSPGGELIGSIHIARDITEEKEREMRMIMTERLASLGQMASGIAHEINNPLESVMICAEMLLMRVAKDTYDHVQFEKYLKIIDEEVLRCRDITTNMLSFSRQTSISRSDIDLHLLLDKAVDLVGYQGRLKNVTVTKNYGEKFLVNGNEGELRQVLLALLINALDAMENKGALTLETGTAAGSAWVRIIDSGPGIDPENLQRIFNPFFSTKTEKGGTGLGLSIAHRIITNHGGSLTVASEQGHGATFTISIPR